MVISIHSAAYRYKWCCLLVPGNRQHKSGREFERNLCLFGQHNGLRGYRKKGWLSCKWLYENARMYNLTFNDSVIAQRLEISAPYWGTNSLHFFMDLGLLWQNPPLIENYWFPLSPPPVVSKASEAFKKEIARSAVVYIDNSVPLVKTNATLTEWMTSCFLPKDVIN